MNQDVTHQVAGLEITSFSDIDQAANKFVSAEMVSCDFAIAINAEKVIKSLNDKAVEKLLKGDVCLYPDGIAVVKTLQQKGAKSVRIPGCELWEAIMKKAAQYQHSVYLLGGSEEVNKATAEKLQSDFGLIKLFRKNGYFESEQQIIEEILEKKPKIITVALGSPKQELLISRLRKVYPNAFYMGVGGTYDVFVGNVQRAPKLFQKLNLEWAFRIIKQPVRVFRMKPLFQYAILHYLKRL